MMKQIRSFAVLGLFLAPLVSVLRPSAAGAQAPALTADSATKKYPRKVFLRQQGMPAPPALAPQGELALEELAPRFATQYALIQGWYRDRAVLYYDFGTVQRPPATPRVYWPVHGFDAQGNPVAMRGQRPIFETVPGLAEYSGLWKLSYIVVADELQPNQLKDIATVDTLVRRGVIGRRETGLTLNLPIVPRGSRLERDSAAGALGWYQGRDVQYFDFGQAQPAGSLMWRFAIGSDEAGQPVILTGQNSLVDSIPAGGAAPAPDLWEIMFVRVDSTYVPNSVKSAAALQSAGLKVDPPSSLRNLPIAFVDSGRATRTASPLTTFADLRSPFPPAPTPPPSQ